MNPRGNALPERSLRLVSTVHRASVSANSLTTSSGENGGRRWPPDTLIAQRSPLSQGVQPPRIDARPLRQEWNLRPGVSDCSAIKAARRIPIFSAFLASPRTFPLTISTGVSHAPAVTLRRPAPRSIGSDLRLLVN